ncbi:MAG: haloacid dehalogenase type II [Rhizobiales bacterium]|nr:haloacid dehalogenase type II [Hyphomicrobiales bacterium]
MSSLRPKFITFDCYGTLTWFQMSAMAREVYADRVAPERMDAFIADFSSYRYDEVLGDWKPYGDVIRTATRRVCERWGIDYVEDEGTAFYDAVPTWGPHPDVPAPLARVAREYPLVILSNASDNQLGSNVEKLGAPFHRVLTAQQARAYKPRFKAFEYMFDELGCGPEDILHVSSSIRYDIMAAALLGVRNKVYVNRGYEPSVPAFGYHEMADLGGLPGVVGL